LILLDGSKDILLHTRLPEVKAFLSELDFHLDSSSPATPIF